MRPKEAKRFPVPLALLLATTLCSSAQVKLRFTENETVTWSGAIEMYRWLDRQYPSAKLVEYGTTDVGKPLHLFIISGNREFTPEKARESGKNIIFINNGIHPGEPCGVDASLKLAEGLLSGSDPYGRFLEHNILVIVPLFNVGGALNRGKYNRANQNGPLEHGFRGNARNLDLNRDFMKFDSKNAQSLAKALREWEPHIFVDTHTTDGADYPYVVTLIHNHLQRLEPAQAAFMENTMLPWLTQAMQKTPYELSPYIWSLKQTPEDGIVQFMDYPRYTMGYASLFNILSFTIETHMFKPFEDRVMSTWYLLREFLRFSELYGQEIRDCRSKSWEQKMDRDTFTLEWALDTSVFRMIPFRGYRAGYKPSRVTGYPRLYYDRNDTWEREIRSYEHYTPVATARVPGYYLLPQAWSEAVERLRMNGVEWIPLKKDTLLRVEALYIEDLETPGRPYNGHYWHPSLKIRKEILPVRFFAGDLLIPTRQKAIEYVVQALEPLGYDSFFRWNFFDGILFRNEYFSPYIFEETADELLKSDPDLKEALDRRKREDESFSRDPVQQLRFIYEHSPWSEPTYLRVPVFRLPAAGNPGDL